MAHTYMLFDFGADEDKAQQARHKLEAWKQAFRLDKKLQFKFDRGESAASPAADAEAPERPGKPGKSKSSKGKAKSSAEAAATDGEVKLLVRLYFSGHEKLSEQRWLDRIPSEEPFKRAARKLIKEGEAEFDETLAQFDRLD
jgi:hypothetical protein